MPILRTDLGNIKVCRKKNYFTIGRAPENDLALPEKFSTVSRFHATIFKNSGNYYLIDHSANGTHYNPEEETFDNNTQLDPFNSAKVTIYNKKIKTKSDLEDSLDISQSEMIEEQESPWVPKIPNFVEHGFREEKDVKDLIDCINDPEQADLLKHYARRLVDDSYIGIFKNLQGNVFMMHYLEQD